MKVENYNQYNIISKSLMIILKLSPDQCGGGNPCQNGGTCTNRMGGNNCVCQEGYSGEYCSLGKHEHFICL